MVYRGRPSTGCKTCRQRKIKCDERPEGCVKCADKGYKCPGYERTIDQLFRDETASVQRKAQVAKAKALIAREERHQAEKAQRAVVRTQSAIDAPLPFPLLDRGVAFFMMHYAEGLDIPPMSSMAYNQHCSTFGFHPIVATVMTALGLAGAGNLFEDGRLKREATTWYLDALRMTNRALSKPSEAKSDSTLLATILLSIFEATHNEVSFGGWSHHITGSASLLRMRGMAQFATPAGRRMYFQIVGLLTMRCMGMGIALPRFVHQMNKEVEKWENKNDPGNRYFHLHIAAIDFRAQILNHELTDLHAIIERSLEIDSFAKSIFESVGQEWEYIEETCDPGTRGVFGTTYHVYPHLTASQTWNWVRYIRIYIHDVIRNSLIAGFSSKPPVFVGKKYIRLLEESTDLLYKMQADIFASIPQYLHDTPKVPSSWSGVFNFNNATPSDAYAPPTPTPSNSSSSAPTWGPVSTSTNTPDTPKLFTSNFLPEPASTESEWSSPAIPADQLPVVRVSGGYSSLWALFIAGSMPIATPESQAYVLASLERVGAEFGINQAKVFASALGTKIELERSGLSELAESDMLRGWDAGQFDWLGDKQRISIRNAALKGGERGIAPIYMPRVGPHLEDWV